MTYLFEHFAEVEGLHEIIGGGEKQLTLHPM
jgi:hypothetical protein